MSARAAKTEAESALVPTVQGDERQNVLMKAIGFDKLSAEERELALNIAQKYDLDLLLGHLVLIDGRAYITRDGLLHVAHGSGVFDGIEVSEPVQMDDGQWRCVAKVWRKDMTHPFVYSGRYAAANRRRGNANYEPEMAIKVAEVMSLRRAFDVAAPVAEERWNEQAAPPADSPETPGSIDDALDAKLATIGDVVSDAVETVAAFVEQAQPTRQHMPQPEEQPQTVAPPASIVTTVSPLRQPVAAVEEQEYGTFSGAPRTPRLVERDSSGRVTSITPIEVKEGETATIVETEGVESPEVAQVVTMAYDDFKGAIRGINRTYLKSVASDMFPNAHGFKELSEVQLRQLYEAVKEDEPQADPTPPAAPLTEPMSVETSATLEAICEHRSPFEGNNRCILPLGHKELHRASDMERWG